VEHDSPALAPAIVETALEVGLAEGEETFHLLGELQAIRDRAHGETMCSVARSAKAAMVSEGLGPTGPGMTEPSTT
jgi:hypothetical protein